MPHKDPSKRREYMREYNQRPEVRERKRKYREENREEINERERVRYHDKRDAERFFQTLAMMNAIQESA